MSKSAVNAGSGKAVRTPFGYYWEHVFERSGEVVNSGFYRHTCPEMADNAASHPERPLRGMAGFVERVRPLYL